MAQRNARFDLSGQKFGRLTVVSRGPRGNTRHARWECECECGARTIVYGFALRAGETRSCGCLMRDVLRARRGERRTGSTSYRTTHKRVRAARGRADSHPCTDCGGRAQEWSYDQADPHEVTEVVRGWPLAYSTDPARYEPRCIPCHRTFDGHWGWAE